VSSLLERRAFRAAMPHLITFKPLVGYSGRDKTFGDAKQIRGRVEQLVRKVVDANAREVVSNTLLILDSEAVDGSAYTPTVNDRYELPDGFSPRTPNPISVERVDDEAGLHHFVVNV
jgi:hypothetical protein